MPSYTYRAKSRDGQLTHGKLVAESERAVVGRLQTMGFFPISVVEAEVESAGASRVRGMGSSRVRTRDVALFTRQLADLLNAGLPLMRALKTLVKQTEHAAVLKAVQQLSDAVKSGSSFADAVAAHPRLFPPLYVGMVRAGESGGMLEVTLARLAEFQEREAELRGKIRSAMAYPLLMMCVGLATMIFLVTFVIPKFLEVIEESGGGMLPLPTRMLKATSDFLIAGPGGLVVVGVIVLVIFGFMRASKTADGRRWIDRLKLRLPVAGSVIRLAIIARFARTLGTLTKGGVPILSALEMVREVVGNTVFRAALEQAQKGVREGASLADQLGRSGEFPPAVVDMVAVGEEGGSVDSALLRVADTFDRDVENNIDMLMSLLEPVMILVMGALVGLIVAAMILPIFELSSGMGG